MRDVVLGQPGIIVVVAHTLAVQENLVNAARSDVEAGGFDGLGSLEGGTQHRSRVTARIPDQKKALAATRQEIAPISYGEPGLGRDGIDSVIGAGQVLMEQDVVREAVVADRHIAKRGILAWPHREPHIAEHSERNVIAARAHGIQVHGIGPAASPSEATPACAGRGWCGGAGERGIPVDGNRNLAKSAAELDEVLRILIGAVDHLGRDVECPQRPGGVVRILVSGAVDVKPGLPVRCAVHTGDIEFELDITLIFAVLDLIDVLVLVHQPGVVGAIHEARAGAAWCDRQRIPDIENRQVRRIEHQILIPSADPFRAAPRARVGSGIHQSCLEPGACGEFRSRLVPHRHRPGISGGRLERAPGVPDRQRM